MSHHDHGDFGVDETYRGPGDPADHGDPADPGDIADDARYTPRHGSAYADDDYGDEVDAEQHGRRNVTIAVAVSGVALVLVALMFWLMSSLSTPKLAADTTAKVPATTTTTGAVAAVAPETSVTPPSIGTYTPTTTFSLPPPEQPTMTAAAPPTTQAPAPAPSTTTQAAPAPQPAPPPSAPAAVSITNVRLTCAKGDGRKITGTLSFTTNTKVTAGVAAGDGVQSKSAGPGDVTLTASGRGNPVCIGKINDQVVGPVPAT